MSSIIQCPHCHGEFNNEPLEEIINPTITVSRKSTERSSWQTIADLIDCGEAYRQLSVGDSITCTLKNDTKIAIDVLDINAYGGEEVIFGVKDSFGDYNMNPRSTNNGGFPKSKMLTHLEEDIFPLLPDDLQAVITPRVIRQRFNGGTFETTARLWLPSLYEVYGEKYAQYSCETGEKQYQFFKNPKNRIKFERDGEYSIYWWLRSPFVGNSTFFWGVYGYGGTGIYGASSSYGVCPCFSICKRDLKALVAE